MIPYDWQWWRRLCGGRWATVTGWLWGRRWVRVPAACVERVEEDWARGGWHAPFDAVSEWWSPVYCRFAWFHLMRAESDGHFIVVYQRKGLVDGAPEVDGYYIDSSSWTPWGCEKAAQGSLRWARLMEHLGDDGRRRVVEQVLAFKRGPQEPKP